MKTCPQCGNQNQDNAKYCHGCGHNLQDLSSGDTQENDNQNNYDTYQQLNSNQNIEKEEYHQYDYHPNDQQQYNQQQYNQQQYNQQQYNQQQYNQQSNYQAQYPVTNQKITWLGPLLNILGGLVFYFLCGIGQIYLGLYKRGLILCAFGFIPLIIGVIIILQNEFAGTVISLIIGLILMLYSAYDAYVCANAINNGQPIPLLFGSIDVQ